VLTLTDVTKQTLLHAAVDSSNVSAIKSLIEIQVADKLINCKDEFLMTPIHLAGINYSKECFILLMTLNPDVSQLDSDGQSVVNYIESNEEIDEFEKKEILNKINILNEK
jgi:hypothetical protein